MNSKWIIALVAAGAMAVGCQNSKKSSTSPSMNGSALNVPAAAPAPAMAYTPPASAQPVIADAPIQPTASAADVPADDIASSPTPAASPAPKRAISSSRARTASAKTASGTHYTIKKGESLWSIAQSHYGNGNKWKAIAAANPKLDPNKIQAGQTIVLP